MTHQDTQGAELLPDTAALKPFITEMLMHRGENPYQVKRGGYELWEAYIPSVLAALRYLPLYRHPPAPADSAGEIG